MEGNNSYTANTSDYNGSAHVLKQSKLNQPHEKNILSEKNKHELDILDKKNAHDVKLKDKELGWFGVFFWWKRAYLIKHFRNTNYILIYYMVNFKCYNLF